MNAILVWVAVFGAPILFFSFLRYLRVGAASILAMHSGVYLFWVLFAVYREKIPVRTKALFVIGCSFIIAVTSIAEWGIFGSGVAYLIFISILVTIFYGPKPGIVFTIINLMIMVAATILFTTGILHFDFDPNEFSSNLPSWISTSSVYGCFTLILVGCLGRLYNSMAVSIKNLTNRTIELHQAKEQMEKEIRNRNQAESALQESEERFRVVLENLPGAVFVHDLEGKNLIVSDEACKSTGFSRNELLSTTIQETEKKPFNIDLARKTWQQLVETGEAIRGRNAGYPAPPAQSRTCSIPASGSSVVLAFAQDETLMQTPFDGCPP